MDPRTQLLIRYAGAFAPGVAASASGSFVETTDGRRLLDFTAGQIFATIGHNHPGSSPPSRTRAGRCCT